MRSNRHQQLSLYELTQKIQNVLAENFDDSLWVSAEISELKENRTGHCYLELVEKDKEGNQPKAKVRATIWAGIYRVLRPFFETSTGVKLSSGIKVLVLCQVSYHPVYGFSLNIQDIDSTFTLGDIEQKRRETINRLIAEGVFDMNKELEMPLLPKRIAIISSPTAAGYQDFTNQLELNSYGYRFEYKIFSAVVQGDKAEESMIEAFGRINMELEKWDIVALIRGGGSQTDLSCFDGYELANHIAQFPIPVITGIGHEKDTSIADMVAHTRLKTPTAAAEFIINQFVEAESLLISLKDSLADLVHWMVNDQKLELSRIQNRLVPNVMKVSNAKNIELKELRHKAKEFSRRFVTSLSHDIMLQKQLAKLVLKKRIEREDNYLNTINSLTKKGSQNILFLAKNRIGLLEKNLSSIKPENVLKRGFSITLFKGKSLKDVHYLSLNDEIESILSEGSVISWVKKTQKE